ncbi:Mur ligase family protein, partial [Alphaproteobacteria bacterium]|nr:Mur ligase family protein [Alphaproteobacteria bacterium]
MPKPVAVFGLGISNLSVIKSLTQQGQQVIAWDDNESMQDKAKILGATIKELTREVLKTCEVLVLAPGVPLHFPEPNPVVKAAQAADIEIICDIELRYRQGWSCKTIGITGTNGKSTTTALIGHTLKQAGIETAIGGNIGTPIFDLEIPDENGILVLELSSYQLDLCPTFRPGISVLLNIAPDHLDRHGTMDNYAAA